MATEARMDLIILIYVLLIIAFAKAFGEIATRFGQPSIVGELFAGIALGPALLGAVFDGLEPMYENQFITDLGELGMLFFMLYVGLELSPRNIFKASWPAGIIAAVGLFIPAVLGMVVGVAFGLSGLTLVFAALAMSVTALPVTVRILKDMEVLQTRTSNVVVNAALVTDLVLLIALGVILGTEDRDDGAQTALYLAASILVFFFLAYMIGRYIVPHLYQLLRWMRTGEAAFAIAIGLAITLAVTAEWAGLPGVIGAFVAGMLLREAGTGLRVWARVEEILSGVTLGFLAPIFFVFIGFSVDFGSVAANLGFFGSILAVAIGGKMLGTYIPSRAGGLGHNESVAVGAMMMGKGAMELVFAQIALDQGLIDETLFSLLVLMAFTSTFLAPVLFKHFYNKAVCKREIPPLVQPPEGKKSESRCS